MNIVDPDAPIITHKDGQKLPSYSHMKRQDSSNLFMVTVRKTEGGYNIIYGD